tara:strand:- start:183 stop:749 length:567 start_codon:yes stop_codon:yes gene_type:complete
MNHKRQCVFFATTNKKDFLSDSSGNRRFNPVDAVPERITKHVVNELPKDVDQIWAEAVQLYKNHEPLYLSPEAEKLAKKEQHKHSETDERTGVVEHFLEAKLPSDWGTMDIFERRILLDSEPKEGVARDVVCVAEIWCECLGKKKEDMDRFSTRGVNEIMKGLEGWEAAASTKNFKIYGKQRFYSRKK